MANYHSKNDSCHSRTIYCRNEAIHGCPLLVGLSYFYYIFQESKVVGGRPYPEVTAAVLPSSLGTSHSFA